MASNVKEKKIFISYKRKDKDIVFPIVDEIRNKIGVNCWIDMEGIESGDQFQNVIINAIDEADIVAFMLSENFIAPYIDEKTGQVDLKKQTFTEREVMYALRHNKRLIPISIDNTTVYDCKWLEFNCSGLDCIDWNDINQRNKLFQNLQKWLDIELSIQHEEKAMVKSIPKDSGTIAIESFPDYACVHINVSKDCKILRFGKSIGEIKQNEWGELYLRTGKHELQFVSEDAKTETKIIEIPTVNYTDFIYVKFDEIANKKNHSKFEEWLKRFSKFFK